MIKISKLNRLAIVKNVFFFEGKLYERLYSHPRRLKYRFFLSTDDYDYVVDRNLRRRLDRAYDKQGA